MKKLIAATSLIILLASCTKQSLTPEQQITYSSFSVKIDGVLNHRNSITTDTIYYTYQADTLADVHGSLSGQNCFLFFKRFCNKQTTLEVGAETTFDWHKDVAYFGSTHIANANFFPLYITITSINNNFASGTFYGTIKGLDFNGASITSNITEGKFTNVPIKRQ